MAQIALKVNFVDLPEEKLLIKHFKMFVFLIDQI